MARDVRVPARYMPTYCKPVEELESAQVEVLVVHASHLLRRYRLDTRGSPGPASDLGSSSTVTTVSLDRPRSVTWVHIVLGTWLLVASSDEGTSALEVWPLSDVLRSARSESIDREPSQPAAFYLDGPVRDGRVHVRDGRAVVALEIHSP